MFQFCCILKEQNAEQIEQPSLASCFYVCTKVFTLHNFPYEDTYEMWSNVQSANGQGRYA